MDLKAALEFLVGVGKGQRTTEVKEFPNDPDRRLLIKADGSHESLETPRDHAKRNHKVATILDFVAACAHLVMPAKDAGEATETEKKPSPIWFDARQVVVFPDDRYRDERITLDLPASAQLNLISGWSLKPVDLGQKQLVRILRHDLDGCVDRAILAAFRTMNFEVIATAKRNIQHGAQSMDRDVQSAVNGPSKEVTGFAIELPLFDHFDFRAIKFTVKVTVDLDAENEIVSIQLLPGELRRAQEASLEAVRSRLQKELDGATLIAGQP